MEIQNKACQEGNHADANQEKIDIDVNHPVRCRVQHPTLFNHKSIETDGQYKQKKKQNDPQTGIAVFSQNGLEEKNQKQ